MHYIKKLLKFFIPTGVQSWLQLKRAQFAARSYGYPAKRLTVIAVAGTHGKTTTAHLIARILQSSGYKIGLISSINFQIDDKIIKNETPVSNLDPFVIQHNLRQMVKAGCRYAILEVGARSLLENRYWGIDFSAAVLTNISQENTENFPNLASYRKAYESLFEKLPSASIINADDPSATHFLKYRTGMLYTYGTDQKADFLARKVLPSLNGIDFTAITPEGQFPVNLNFPGRFNIYNSLAAIALGYTQGIPVPQAVKALSEIEGIAGRMENIACGQHYNIIVDYARNPKSLEMVYEAAQKTTRGSLIAVLGASGGKNPNLRPALGELAGRFADYVILTSEDPRMENPGDIIDQIAKGVVLADRPHYYRANTPFKAFKIASGTGESEWWWKIPDRHSAIEKALLLANRGDTVIITGKGDDITMVTGDKFIPWSDRHTIENILEKHLPAKNTSHQTIPLPKNT